MKTYEEHYSEMNNLVEELLLEAKKKNIDLNQQNIVETYGRLSLLYFYNLVKDYDLEYEDSSIEHNVDLNNYIHMKLFANTFGTQAAFEIKDNKENTDPESFIKIHNNVLYLIKKAVNNNGWNINIEPPFIETFSKLPLYVAEYLADLLKTSIDMIRPYDVRVLLQISSKNIMNTCTPMWLYKHDDGVEVELIETIILNKFNISLPTLKNEINNYIREHLKTEPKYSNRSWSKFIKKVFGRS